ncbi:MAG: hypothetical protein HY744_13590 [Deltaproteobacteria bacterium]|nr:hypothetical protein [Deltaproteobacteria bacterium]
MGEHHTVSGQATLGRWLLGEREQEMASVFATDRRLVALRSVWTPGRPVTCDERDRTSIVALAYAQILALEPRRRVRLGELLVGLAMVAVALLFASVLQTSGPALALVGVLGALHAVALPTRWIEVRTRAGADGGAICIAAPRRRSARALVRLVRAKAGLLPGVREPSPPLRSESSVPGA